MRNLLRTLAGSNEKNEKSAGSPFYLVLPESISMVIGWRLAEGYARPPDRSARNPVRRGTLMDDFICSCLQLSADRWPPDHYTLLGLEPQETDTTQIERRVEERMEELRRYQLTHADQVTDGMNRLAQALVCLTDPVARQAYDAMLRARSADARARARRPDPSVGLRFSPPRMELDRAPSPRAHSRGFPRWLLFAWSLWLLIGVGGLMAVILNFPDIKASYSGAKATKKLQEPRAAVPPPARRRGP